jgi:phosphoribosylformimino-5-aminoimidazole carboxamide ribotide isomerase
LNELKLDRVVLGTVAINNFDLTSKILQKFGKEKIVLALDCQRLGDNYFPKANGWLEETKEDLFTILEKYKNIAKYILCTDIAVDGTMQGPNFDLYKKIKNKFPQFLLQASGGVSSVKDLEDLQEITDFAIVGKMLYEAKIC